MIASTSRLSDISYIDRKHMASREDRRTFRRRRRSINDESECSCSIVGAQSSQGSRGSRLRLVSVIFLAGLPIVEAIPITMNSHPPDFPPQPPLRRPRRLLQLHLPPSRPTNVYRPSSQMNLHQKRQQSVSPTTSSTPTTSGVGSALDSAATSALPTGWDIPARGSSYYATEIIIVISVVLALLVVTAIFGTVLWRKKQRMIKMKESAVEEEEEDKSERNGGGGGSVRERRRRRRSRSHRSRGTGAGGSETGQSITRRSAGASTSRHTRSDSTRVDAEDRAITDSPSLRLQPLPVTAESSLSSASQQSSSVVGTPLAPLTISTTPNPTSTLLLTASTLQSLELQIATPIDPLDPPPPISPLSALPPLTTLSSIARDNFGLTALPESTGIIGPPAYISAPVISVSSSSSSPTPPGPVAALSPSSVERERERWENEKLRRASVVGLPNTSPILEQRVEEEEHIDVATYSAHVATDDKATLARLTAISSEGPVPSSSSAVPTAPEAADDDEFETMTEEGAGPDERGGDHLPRPPEALVTLSDLNLAPPTSKGKEKAVESSENIAGMMGEGRRESTTFLPVYIPRSGHLPIVEASAPPEDEEHDEEEESTIEESMDGEGAEKGREEFAEV